jgi:hypothetical protein
MERKQKIFPMRRDERRHGFGVLYPEAKIIHSAAQAKFALILISSICLCSDSPPYSQ